MGETAVAVKDLRKSYGDVEAVGGIDLAVGVGEVFALLGPNGAGKTTTVEILEGYRERDAGEVAVLGSDPAHRSRDLRHRVGIVLQSTGVDPYLTVRETVDLYARYYPSPRNVAEVVDLVGLSGKLTTRVLKLSGGQQRRLDVAIALAGDPELLFLDEPTTGFDPGARRNAWEIVRNLTELGKTVFLTTHYMDEAQYLADRVAVIANGRIVAEGPPATLGDRHLGQSVIRFRRPPGDVPSIATGAAAASEEIELTVTDPTRTLHELTSWAVERGIVLEGRSGHLQALEDVYLELTGGEAGAE